MIFLKLETMGYFTAEETMVKVVINGIKLPKDDVGVGGGEEGVTPPPTSLLNFPFKMINCILRPGLLLIPTCWRPTANLFCGIKKKISLRDETFFLMFDKK